MGREARARRKAYINTGREPARACPVCREILDGSTGVVLDRPDMRRMIAGDLTICAYCAAVCVLTAEGFRIATQEEFDSLDPDLRRLLAEYKPRPAPRRTKA